MLVSITLFVSAIGINYLLAVFRLLFLCVIEEVLRVSSDVLLQRLLSIDRFESNATIALYTLGKTPLYLHVSI